MRMRPRLSGSVRLQHGRHGVTNVSLLVTIYGGVHNDPGSRQRFLADLMRRHAPQFVAVEWARGVFERLAVWRPWIEENSAGAGRSSIAPAVENSLLHLAGRETRMSSDSRTSIGCGWKTVTKKPTSSIDPEAMPTSS